MKNYVLWFSQNVANVVSFQDLFWCCGKISWYGTHGVTIFSNPDNGMFTILNI